MFFPPVILRTVAAGVVAEVLLQEDLHSAYATLAQSWYDGVTLFLSAYSSYYSVQVRLIGYYLLGWAKYFSIV